MVLTTLRVVGRRASGQRSHAERRNEKHLHDYFKVNVPQVVGSVRVRLGMWETITS